MTFGLNYSLKSRILAGISVLAMLVSMTFPVRASSEPLSLSDQSSVETWKSLLENKNAEDSYLYYLESHKQAAMLENGPALDSSAVMPESKNVIMETDGVLLNADGQAVFGAEIAEEGLYSLRIEYMYTDASEYENSDLSILIDDKVPFHQAQLLSLPRIWTQKATVHENGANDRLPDVIQSLDKASYVPVDESGIEGYYYFFLTKGFHKISLTSETGGFCVMSVKIGLNKKSLPDIGKQAYTGELITIEAEDFYLKNDSSISGGTDRTNAATIPNDPVYKKINILDGDRFIKPNQMVTWSFHVKESGRFRIALRFKQDSMPGLFVSRNLYIDGIPLTENENAIRFDYDDNWQLNYVKTSGKDEIVVDLAAGEHTISLEVTLGELSEYVQRLDDVIFALNCLYRKIVMITGSTPDLYRDYDLEAEIPILIPCFRDIEAELNDIYSGLQQMGASGGLLSVLRQTAQQLNDFHTDSYRLQDRLSQYASNISSISSLTMTMQEQPLALDRIFLVGSENTSIKYKAGFFESFWFNCRAFLGSFFCDYSMLDTVGSDATETITAWYSGSREQAEVLQNVIGEQFSVAHKDIAVDLKLVTLPLTQAILAGTAPDVCLSVGRNQPVNLGARGVLEDLSKYEGYSDVHKTYGDNLIRPYIYKDAVYGIPITLDYHMMFYRKDVLEEFDLQPPETWDQFYEMIPVLQQSNLFIGLPYTLVGASEGSLGVKDIFATLLLQRKANIYSDDLLSVRLDDRAVGDVFKEWTEFYSKYGFSLEYNFYNRFRTGEMPLAIASYSSYMMLESAAPEIKGLWEMSPIPGTRLEDGSIDNSEAASGTAVIMLKDSKHKAATWEFIKWWSSADAQSTFGNKLEVLMGKAARYTPANQEAVKKLYWSDEALNALMKQRESITELPEVLGGYYVVRSLDNAFRTVLYNNAHYKEALLTQNEIINTEMARKQREFS